MPTTATSLQTKKVVETVLSLAFDGLPYVFTNGSTSKMTTAFAAVTDFSAATFLAGLQVSGSIGGQISPFDPSVSADSLEFTVAETRGTLVTSAGKLATTFLRAGHAQTQNTTITADVLPDDTTISVKDTSVLNAPTTDAYIGNETFEYVTILSGTALRASTRGRFAIWTRSGGGRFAHHHKISTATSFAPKVTNAPRSDHYNRGVILRIHYVDPQSGVYDTTANALTLWQGRVKAYRWNGDGTLTFSCRSLMEQVEEGTLFSDQYTARIPLGTYFYANQARFYVHEDIQGTTAVDFGSTLSGTGASHASGEIASAITNALGVAKGAGSIDNGWLLSTVAGGLYRFRLVKTVTAGTKADFAISLHPLIWQLLGWERGLQGDEWHDTSTGTDYHLVKKRLALSAAGIYDLVAPQKAILYLFTPTDNGTLTVTGNRGTWANQPVVPELEHPLPTTTKGFVQIGDVGVFAVNYVSATSLTILRDVTKDLAPAGFAASGYDSGQTVIARDGDAPAGPVVKQVWWERDGARDVIKRFVFSTGKASYNNADDLNPYGMGIAIPHSATNYDSFNVVGTDLMTFVLTEPTKFVDLLDSALSVSGLYLVTKQGLLTVRALNPAGNGVTPAVTLTESNKAGDPGSDDPQRLQVTYGSDGIINRVVLQYNRTVNGEFRDSLTVEDLESITNYGSRKTLTIRGYCVGQDERNLWIDAVAARALAFFSRPMARARRTFTFQEWGAGISAGDTALVTDSGMIDPADGTHGLANLPAVVLGWSFDLGRMRGEVDLLLFPEVKAAGVGAWAPAGRITGYVAGTKTITCAANQYSHSSQAADATRFVASDKVRMVEWSPTDPAAPSNFQGTVSSQSGNTVVLTTDPTAGAGLTAGKTYNLIYDKITIPVQASQKKLAFIADDANDSTGAAANDAYQYGDVPDLGTITYGAVNYNQRFIRPRNVADDTAEAFSVSEYADAVLSYNNFLSHATQPYAANDYFETNVTQVGTSWKLAAMIAVPCFGWTRSLVISLLGKHSVNTSSASFKITATADRPLATALVAAAGIDFSGDPTASTATATTTATSSKWLAEQTLSVAPHTDAALPPNVWLTVEIKAGAAGETVTLYQVAIRESVL